MIISDRRGVAPLLEFCDTGEDLSGFSAADRVVGKAAALLYVRLKVRAVYAEVLSKSAQAVLTRNGISCDGSTVVDSIMNRAGDGMCPMEMTVLHIDSPEEALAALREKIAMMRSGMPQG